MPAGTHPPPYPPTTHPCLVLQDMIAEMNRRFSFCTHDLMNLDLDATVIGYKIPFNCSVGSLDT